METILPFAIFGAITCGAWFLISYFTTRKSKADQRLDELRDPTLRQREQIGDKQTGARAMIAKAAPVLSKVLESKTELESNELKVRLANAGFNSPAAPQLFRAAKVALGILGVIVGTSIGISFWGLSQNGLASLV
ncbi:MAG: type II secretion system F family protein, partial [Planctomycetaceae bacterium]